MTLAYEVEGKGPHLLLLRPLGGSMVLWGAFRARLLEQFTVIAFDPRGAGASPPAPPWTTTHSMARDALSILDRLSVERAHVFGLSLGGMVATILAAEHPLRVNRLVLASTMPWGLTARHASPLRALSLARCLAQPGAACEACLARRVLSDAFARDNPTEVARIVAEVSKERASRASLLALLGAAARHDAKSLLPRIDAKTLVLAGSRDTLAAPDSQRWLARQIRRARFDTLDCGHDLTLEKPLETAERVIAALTT